MDLGIRQLRYFVAVAQAGAISRAAEALNIAQSAVSHHMSECEAALGVALFERRPRGVALTPAGQRLLEHARGILAALERAQADVKSFTDDPSGPVSVGLSYTAATAAALGVMTTINRACPRVHLTILEGLSSALTERVLCGSLDFAAVYNPPHDARLLRVDLLDEDLFLIGRPALIGASTGPIAFADLPQKMVLGLNPVPASRAIINTQFLRNQITPHPQLEIDSLNALRHALCGGLGCAVLARSAVGPELASGSLHARRIVEPALTRSLKLVSLADRPQTRTLVEVGRHLLAAFAAEVESGHWPVSTPLE